MCAALPSKDWPIAALKPHRGPWADGGRSAYPPWNGVVEDTPQLHIRTVCDAARRIGACPTDVRIEIGDLVATIEGVRVGFGVRYYFRCPVCHRRCEALYYLPTRLACRKCQRLGYRSQKYRSTSVFAALDALFRGHRWHLPGRALRAALHEATYAFLEATAREMRHRMEEQIEEMLKKITLSASRQKLNSKYITDEV
ncbi:MAG: hypothetical protein Q9M35_09265 [Rhodothermus sp.]|nr:hypothetical protein [Rhodothermus sp.]